MPDLSKLQDMVTYDIVPELESYLHSIGKRLHTSLDGLEESAAKKLPKLSNENGGEDSQEDEKQDDDGRSRRDQKASKNRASGQDSSHTAAQ